MVQAAQILAIPDAETFSAQIKYLGEKKVEATFSIRRDAKSQRFERKAVFSFAALSEEELVTMAMYSAKVRLQAILRALSPEVMLNPQTLSTIDVKRDLLEADKVSSDPVTAAVRSIMKATGLDEAGAKALLDQAKQKAEAVKPKAGAIKTLLKAS
jgi:hypothetical protein